MILRRAIGISFIGYIATVLFGVILSISVGHDFLQAKDAPWTVWFFGILISILIATVCEFWYLQNPKVKRLKREGFRFGLTYIITGILLSVLIYFSLLSVDSVNFTLQFMSTWPFWLEIGTILILATFLPYELRFYKK